MEIHDAQQIVTAGAWADHVEALPPGRFRVATLDHLADVTPAMLEWWFAHLDRPRYLAFHPVDHKEFGWVRGKRPGAYVGATHLTHQQYGGAGPLMRAEITFLDPWELFDPAVAEAHGAGFVLSAVIHLLNADGRPRTRTAGRFVHVGLDRDGGTELRNCWWLEIDKRTDLQQMTAARLRHVHEEFGYLAALLPGLYTRAGQG